MKFTNYKFDYDKAIVQQDFGGTKRLVASPEHLTYLLELDDSHVVRSRSSQIWRYMKFEYAEELLRSSRLYVPRVDKLNEPLEGSFCPPAAEVNYPEEMQVTPEQATRWAEDHAMFRKAFMQESFYVSCWHICQSESEMMWKRYLTGDNGNQLDGVAVVTTIDKLLRLAPQPFDLQNIQVVPVRFAGEVTYIDHKLPEAIPKGELTLFYKDQAFNGDNEFRLILKLWAYGWEHFDRTGWPKEYQINFSPGTLIDRVVLSRGIPQEKEQRLKQLASTHDSRIQVERSRLERTGIW